eukprot:COSAG02_NODE_50202_length_322_cov_0.654709_1_plen_87_part_10
MSMQRPSPSPGPAAHHPQPTIWLQAVQPFPFLQRRLPLVDADRLLSVKAALDQCLEMLSATEEVEEVDSFGELLADWQQRVEALEPG